MDAVETLVSSARTRTIANLVAEQAAAGLCAALGGMLLLLLAGTDALGWPWLVALFGGGAAFSAWRTWRGLPSLYDVAQRIDQRLGLSDTLSTAVAFEARPAHSSETAWRLQRASAEETSRQLTPSQAAPFYLPRQAKWLAGLLAATAILIGVRYGVLGTLDLRHPLVAGLSEFLPAKVGADVEKALAAAEFKAGPGENIGEEKTEEPEKQDDQQQGADPNAPQMDMPQNQQGDPQEGGDLQAGDQQQEGMENDQQQQADGENQQGDSSKQAKDEGNNSESDQQQASNESNNQQQSLLDKVRDSIANLMNKMQPQKGGQKGQKQGGQQQQQQQNAGNRDQQNADQQGQGEQGEQSAEKQQGGNNQKDAQANQDSAASASNQKASSNDPKTGHGNQDGSKEIKAAQQLEAMGKLSEIIGQRSKTVEGEIMMERKSSQQHDLKTAYQEKNASHREAGSDLRRDEIPVELHHYIERYFAKIRQQPAAKAKTP